MELEKVFLVLLAYLLGSIPTAVWVGKLFYGIDIREHGSGNAGATNTFRILGKKAGIPVLLFDVLKGSLSVLMIHSINISANTDEFIYLKLALGISAILGHIFPVYVGFRGGKGVATLLGAVLAIQPEAAIFSIIIFLIVLFSSRYVSLSSMLAGLSYPILVIVYLRESNLILIGFSVLVSILLIITHKRNIDRLIKRQESKVNFFGKKTEIKS